MSISFAGLGIVSFQNPFTELAGLVVGKGDLRTMLCLLVFCIVALVLAYLTNPSESTFRAYLTEQSFRQHLSRLDENCDDVASKLRESAPRMPSSRIANPVTSHVLPFDGNSPFHFANRASISLRTPKHVFHSFGIFTVAAMIPLPKSPMRDDRNSFMISDSWYIGAFGKWWRGGILETWYQDVISRSKDEESWRSGILNMKSLDMLKDFAGPVAKLGLSNGFVNGSPPKLRNRERPTCRNTAIAPRSISPPPLPKSATLPLHTTRVLPTTPERPITVVSHHPLAQPLQQSDAFDSNAAGSSIPSRSPSTLFDQSPRIAHLLEQISSSKTYIVDLRAQLLDCQTTASQTHALLQEEVNSFRERKRIEDAGKLETKSRTKALEDSKRSAEAVKRDVDKRLKTAQSAHDQAAQRIESLDKDIVALQDQTQADEGILRQSADEISSAECELAEELERKKQEIKDAEDIVVALNQRARELEEQLEEEREKLRGKKNLIENRKAKRSSQALTRGSSWSLPQHGFMDSSNGPLESNGQAPQLFDAFTPYQPPLRLNTIPAFDSTPSPVGEPLLAHTPYDGYPAGFIPNGFADEVSRSLGLPAASPTGQSLIPSGLITSLDVPGSIGASRSFQSDTDPYLEKEWRSKPSSGQGHEGFDTGSRTYDPFCASPVSFANPSFPSSKRSSLDGHHGHVNRSAEEMDVGQGPWSDETLYSVDGDSLMEERKGGNVQQGHKAGTRRWFPTLPKDKSRKGLNPDAKEFNMTLSSSSSSSKTHQSLPSFDNLNPTGLGSSMLSSSSTSTSESLFLRAFAPSPAEREALQRALGGANTSFERLPSLSDVGSIPSSPSHIHALPHAPNAQTNKLQLPSWLPNFPRGRKPQFSPWGDEEMSSSKP